jgi:hypothetical protein
VGQYVPQHPSPSPAVEKVLADVLRCHYIYKQAIKILETYSESSFLGRLKLYQFHLSRPSNPHLKPPKLSERFLLVIGARKLLRIIFAPSNNDFSAQNRSGEPKLI